MSWPRRTPVGSADTGGATSPRPGTGCASRGREWTRRGPDFAPRRRGKSSSARRRGSTHTLRGRRGGPARGRGSGDPRRRWTHSSSGPERPRRDTDGAGPRPQRIRKPRHPAARRRGSSCAGRRCVLTRSPKRPSTRPSPGRGSAGRGRRWSRSQPRTPSARRPRRGPLPSHKSESWKRWNRASLDGVKRRSRLRRRMELFFSRSPFGATARTPTAQSERASLPCRVKVRRIDTRELLADLDGDRRGHTQKGDVNVGGRQPPKQRGAAYQLGERLPHSRAQVRSGSDGPHTDGTIRWPVCLQGAPASPALPQVLRSGWTRGRFRARLCDKAKREA